MAEDARFGRERYQKLTLPNDGSAELWFERLGDRVEMHHSFRTAQGSGSGGGGNWSRCSQHGCLGEALTAGGLCIAHADPAQRSAHLASLPGSSRMLSLRGITVSQQLWNEILSSPVFANNTMQVPITFAGSEINASIRLEGRHFYHHLDFMGAGVFAHIELRGCTFQSSLSARFAFFNGGALNCYGSTFAEPVDFSYSRTERVSLGFEGCTFSRDLNADGFAGAVHLGKSEVHGQFACKHSTATLIMNGCRIDGSIDFAQSELKGFHGEGMTVESANRLGPCKIESVNLRRSTFGTRIHMEVESNHIDLSSSNLKGGGLLESSGGKILLDQITLGGPLRVTGKIDGKEKPKVLGLLNADVGQMSFARVDLTQCSFYGAHGLGSVDIESNVTFSVAPWWAGRRKYIADELAWRENAGRVHRLGWVAAASEFHVGGRPPQPRKFEPPKVHLRPLEAAQVAVTYRELRRSLESKSDMPGAADFYYGEMEMRRWSKQGARLDRMLATAYWMFSGYGLRPVRAFVWWLLAVSGGAYTVRLAGFAEGEWSVERGLLFALRASLPGITTLEKLTQHGQAVETTLRVVGPVFLALFVLALRARVMRKPSE